MDKTKMIEKYFSNTKKLPIDAVLVNLIYMVVLYGCTKSVIKIHPEMSVSQVLFSKSVQ